MCGIIAYIGDGDATPRLLSGLSNLDYRGYDSAGIAVKNGSKIGIEKRAGRIEAVEEKIDGNEPEGNMGIGHTRWSTHGPPTDENAHPHTCPARGVAVVHNGIIENHEALRAKLEDRGHEFTSETDTEVVPHLIGDRLENGDDPVTAFRTALDQLEGSYAISAIVEGTDAIFASRQGSPLVLGIDDDAYYLASDVPAFLEFTYDVVYLESDDFAVVTPDDVTIFDGEENVVSRPVETVSWDAEETTKGAYEHFMLKEIDIQPNALENTLSGRINESLAEVELDGFGPGTFDGVESVHFVGCGTSYHAALYGSRLVTRAGIPAYAIRASEYGSVPTGDNTLFVAVTQSGETADTLDALREAQDRGAQTMAVTNVMGSTAAREAGEAMYIRAGPEIGVAATKTFSSQSVSLGLLAERIVEDVDAASPRADKTDFLRALNELPAKFEEVLDTSAAKDVSEEYQNRGSYFFIGHKLATPVAKEGALKFKEITYEHAEGFTSGELKHGPLALVTSDTVVVAVFTGDGDERTKKTAEEAKARGADVIGVARADADIDGFVDRRLTIPETHPSLAGLLANVQLQLLSYHTANMLGRAIDKPRNLAKSVTVK